jgi:DedD protein
MTLLDYEEQQDTEVTLSTGKLLGIFFALVAVCAVFFSLGYAVGKNSAPSASTVIMDSAQVASVSTSGGAKPVPAKAADQRPCPEGDPSCVEEGSQQAAPEATGEETPPTMIAPEMQAPNGYMVQVAAVSKQEDAVALVNALRRKEYPVLIVNNAARALYHVQVGPFEDKLEAEAMRSRLAGDGYNAILKR